MSVWPLKARKQTFVGGDKGEGASSIQYLPLPGENGDDGDGTWRTAIWSFLKKTPIKLGDVSGGLIIGIIMLCQTMAHASLANLLVVQGPYCAVVPPLAYMLVGQSPHASISSGAIVAILIDDIIPGQDPTERSKIASKLALLVGCVLVVGGVANGSFFVRFLSKPTLSGFITGGSFIITASQMPKLLGIPIDKLGHGKNFFEMVYNLVMALKYANLYAVFIGLTVMGILQGGKKAKKSLSKWKPGFFGKFCSLMLEFKEFICAVVSTLLVYLLTPTGGEPPLPTVGVLPPGFPPFEIPIKSWDEVRTLAPSAVPVAITSYLTTFSVSQRVADQKNYRLSPSREMAALGAASVAGGFFSTFPVSGSMSRTQLTAVVGIETKLGSFIATLVVIAGLSVLTPALFYLPLCTLSAVILMSIPNLQDFSFAKFLIKNRGETDVYGALKQDFRVWCLAFIVTLALGVLKGIGAAVVLSMIHLIIDVVEPRVVVLCKVDTIAGSAGWREKDAWGENPTASKTGIVPEGHSPGGTFPGICVYAVRGPIIFANAEYVVQETKRIIREESEETEIKVVLLDASGVSQVDATSLDAFRSLLEQLKEKGTKFMIANARGQTRFLLDEYLLSKNLLAQKDLIVGIGELVVQAEQLVNTDGAAPSAIPRLFSQNFTPEVTPKKTLTNGK
jgi:high affinity sulfate transporter 1